MRTIALTTFIFACLSHLFSQPPGAPKTIPGTDTSTVEMDAGRAQDRRNMPDTVRNISKGPKTKTKKK